MESIRHEVPRTIGGALTRFRESGRWSDLVFAAGLLQRQGRLFEAVYGAWCFAVHRPSPVRPDATFDVEGARRSAVAELACLEARRAEIVREVSRRFVPGEPPLDCTLHAFVAIGSGLIVGEYAEQSARLFVHDGPASRVLHPYGDDPSVRHIHSLLRHGEHVYVATGDSGKYLDRYSIVDGALQFDRRVLGRLGGFTTCAVVGGRCWFGTDFSERPNYLWCLQTGAKHFFPRPAFTQWCEIMLPLGDRYLYCINKHLEVVSARRSASVFDTHTGTFVHCSDWDPS